ncbi:MAG: helix-turn-helix transcriptional regulator [Bacteroidetes bacterium]|nr:helix-turn-helix transcriptional regulator [Bacteroidota bacterium]
MSLRENLATNLRRIRREREMSQEEFAALVDVHRTYLTNMEGAKRSPTIDVIEKMAERLDLTFVDLLRDPHEGS